MQSKIKSLLVASAVSAAGFSLGGLSVLISVISSTGCAQDCLECPTGSAAYACYRSEFDNNPYIYCNPDLTTAELTCTFEYGGTYVEEVECAGSDEVGLEEWPSGWPGSEVTSAGGTYYVSEAFVLALLENWTLLLNDSARFQPVTGGYYELTGVASGDFWEILGFQSGDKFTTLNGNDLETVADVWAAYEDVVVSGDTTFVVGYVRSGNSLSKTIVVQ